MDAGHTNFYRAPASRQTLTSRPKGQGLIKLEAVVARRARVMLLPCWSSTSGRDADAGRHQKYQLATAKGRVNSCGMGCPDWG